MSGEKAKGTPRQIRNGQVVDPEALAAFYRHRSESLKGDTHTTTRPATGNPITRAGGLYNYLITALQGKPAK